MKTNKRLVLLFAILMISIGQSIDVYLPSMPAMTIAFNTNPAMIKLTITIAMISYGAVALIYGPLSDYFGRRPIALVGLGIFIGGSILCLLAANVYVLLFGRALQGLGFASACGVSAPTINDVYTGDSLIKAYSYIGMAMAIAPVIAPLLGGYLEHYFNWHAPFAFLLAYSVLIFILFFYFYPETNKSVRKGTFQPLQMVKSYPSMLMNLKYIGFILCLVFILTGEISYVITAPFLLQTQLSVTPIQNGWLILITVGGLLIGSFGSSKLCKRYSVIQLLFLGCVLAMIGALSMLVFAALGKMTVLKIVIPMMLFMIGAGFVYPNAIGGCMSCFPEKSGAATSLAAMFQMGATGLIATLATYLHSTDQLPLACLLFVLSTLSVASLFLATTTTAIVTLINSSMLWIKSKRRRKNKE